jgi:hypothetical protein
MAAGDPTIVREIWERADASGSAAFGDQYSLQAARTELAERGQVFPNVFARFVTANRLRDYDDAVTAGYPRPPLTARYKLGRAHQAVGWKAWRINHLAARIVRFAPRSTGRLNARLRIAVRLPRHGARAVVILVRRNGTVERRRLRQNARGRASWQGPFGRRQIARVEVVLSNGSTRTTCWTVLGPPSYSCLGRPLDDRRIFRFSARLLR